MRLIDAELIEKYIEDGLNEKDPKKRFGHDAIEIMTEIHYAPTIVLQPNDQPPNAPLTLEELREMDGEPVWLAGVSSVNNFKGHWDICDWENGEVVSFPYCAETPCNQRFFSWRRETGVAQSQSGNRIKLWIGEQNETNPV